MEKLLENYNQSEIEEFARLHLLGEPDKQTEFKITKIDKEAKKHNRKAIRKVLIRGALTVSFAAIIYNSGMEASAIGVSEAIDILATSADSVSNSTFLPDWGSSVFQSTSGVIFDGVNSLNQKIGLPGIIIGISGYKLITTGAKDSKKAIKLKQELKELRGKLATSNQIEMGENHAR